MAEIRRKEDFALEIYLDGIYSIPRVITYFGALKNNLCLWTAYITLIFWTMVRFFEDLNKA